MVTSIDGATAAAGRSGGLSGPADKDVFRALRGMADAIVVAAGTVRAEGYGPPRTSEAIQAQRTARGQAPHPRLVLISASLDLDAGSDLFADAPEPPIVLTVDDAPPERLAALEPVAQIVACGSPRVDLPRAAAVLADAGIGCAVVEGGPALNGQLVTAGLVDEVNLTLTPLLVAGDSARVAVAPAEAVPYADLELAHLWQAEGMLFARYVSGASVRSTS